jgi:iron complex outermembrane receptor protein
MLVSPPAGAQQGGEPQGPTVLERLGEFEDIEELDLDDLLRVTISIAAGRAQTLEEAPGIAGVLTAEEIRRLGARTLEDVLVTLPGIEVLRDGLGRGRIVVRGVPGGVTTGSSENVLVLYDGHRLNEDIDGGATIVNLDIPVANIKKIEIVRGPGSALFGANAFLGVINIVSQTSDDLNGVEVGIEAGSFTTVGGAVLVGKVVADLAFSGFVQYRSTEGPRLPVPADAWTRVDQALAPLGAPAASRAPGRTRDERRSLDVSLQATWRDLRLLVRGKDESSGGYVGFGDVLGTRNALDNRQLAVDASYRRAVGQIGELQARIAFTENRTGQFLDPLPPNSVLVRPDGTIVFAPEGILVDARLNSRRIGGELALDKSLGKHHASVGLGLEREATFGLETRGNFDPLTRLPRPSFGPEPPLIPESSRRVASAFLQDVYSPSPRVGLTAGLRWDHYNDFGGTLNPRLAAVIRFPKGLNLKLLYGRAFRSPTLLELFIDFPGFKGNNRLEPATIETLEAALVYRRRNLRIGANYYANFLRNFIVSDRPFNPAQDALIVNTPGIDARGLEIEARRSFGSRHALFANYAYQRPVDHSTKRRIADAPAHLANVGATVGLGDSVSLTPTVLWRGERLRAASDLRAPLGAYALVNVTLRARNLLGSTLEIDLIVRNLFDRTYADPSSPSGLPDDYPRPGRSAYLAATCKF